MCFDSRNTNFIKKWHDMSISCENIKENIKFFGNNTRNHLTNTKHSSLKSDNIFQLTFRNLTCSVRSNSFFFNYLLYAHAHVPSYDFYTIKRLIRLNWIELFESMGMGIRGNVSKLFLPIPFRVLYTFKAIAMFLHSTFFNENRSERDTKRYFAELLFFPSSSLTAYLI